ncbi:MAG: GAF domain-containing protein [Nostoc sp. DedQUE12b]|uniref:GAF domain-containing protein n=1 Tax=Nostoc sp. DedQUE12b TaxID=3075398 RepID=UPI002AD3684E|nr:GAF domain-containing protein [Nostoc sp. DedQUE12b]MDZ8088463.1 GAF domain-containing protein [Nostoc sp. DedQUE12b]
MRKTVVELDLVGYSSIVKMLEENLDVKTVTHLNQQIQGFVNTGLMAVSEMRERVVIASNGDNAVIIFDDATYAYNFAKAVHEYTQLHNASKTEPSAKRWFRIGAATGELAQEDNGKLTGYVIVRAYRLEANANPGEFIVDLDTYNALPDELKQRFDSEETVLGKHDEEFKARRYKMIFNANLTTNEPIEIEVLDLFGKLKPYVLETIAESARNLFKADLTTLHFLLNLQQGQGKYIYEIFSGNPGPTPVDEFSPRQNGLGWEAIIEGKIKVISSSQEDGTLNPNFSNKARRRGSRAYAAIPLLINSEDQVILRSISNINEKDNAQTNEQINAILVGVLYIHYWEKSPFHNIKIEQLQLGEYFADKAVVAIRNAIKYQKLREKTRQLSALQSITQSFNEIGSKLISYIAWNTLNALAADVVVIYEYIQAEKKLQFPPIFAGKFLENKNRDTETIDDNAVPWSLIKGGKDIYASKISDQPILENSSFVNREKIKSAAGILLKANNDLVGVMFIDYRRIHNFVDEEKEIINSLASSAATAIQNLRWSQTRDSIELGIITNQEQIKLIVQKAVEITGADVGEITIFDKSNKKIITQENYVTEKQFEVSYRHGKITENDAAWVKVYEEPRCIGDVDDVGTKLNYKAYFDNINSELGVSVWDQNKSQRGLLIVASHQKEKFNESDKRKLENISSLAYIAVHYAEKDKTIREQTIATVGNLCRKLLSRININNDVKTTKVVLSVFKELISQLDENNEISQLNENNVGKNLLTSLEHILLSNEPAVKKIINDLNESNVEDSKQRGDNSLELMNEEVDQTLVMLSKLSQLSD